MFANTHWLTYSHSNTYTHTHPYQHFKFKRNELVYSHANTHTRAAHSFSWIGCACVRAVRSSCVYVSRWSDWFALTPTIPERDANKQQQNILCVWINSRHFSISIWYTFPQCSALRHDFIRIVCLFFFLLQVNLRIQREINLKFFKWEKNIA